MGEPDMSMLIEDRFAVNASPDETFSFMSDIEQVHPCIPGAELVGRRDDGAYDVKVKVKVGPMSLAYKGVVEIVERDTDVRRAVLKAKANEERGQGTAEATMTMRVEEDGGAGSEVVVSSEMLVTGRVAQMGRGIMVDVSNRMVRDMGRAVEATLSARMEATTAPPPAVPAKAPNAVTLFFGVLSRRFARLFSRRRS
jgi:uncharacterized protein